MKGLLGGKNVQLSNCESGTYCLLGIPRKIFNAQDDLLIAQEIMQKCNILTLPHDRYLYYNEQYYCFRINLMIDQQTLLILLAHYKNALISDICLGISISDCLSN